MGDTSSKTRDTMSELLGGRHTRGLRPRSHSLLCAAPARSSKSPKASLLTAGQLEVDRAWKQDVVLEMNMSVQIELKLLETIEKGVVSRTGIFRRDKIAAQTTDLGEQNPCVIVLLDEQGEGIPDSDA